MEPSTPPITPAPPADQNAAQILADQLRARDAELQSTKQALASQRERTKGALVRSEIASELAKHQFVNDAARSQVASLLERQLVVDDAGGDQIFVRGVDGRAAGEYLAAQLSGPDYEHCIRPAHSGGTGRSQGGHRSPPASGLPAPAMTAAEFNALPFGQKAMLASKALTEERRGELANTPASLDMRQPFGLPSKRRSG